MNQVYSEDTYWGLTVFHMAFPVALCAVFIFLVNPLFILLLIFDFKLAIGLIIWSLIGIRAVSLQYKKNIRYAGFLVLINLAIEVYFFIFNLKGVLYSFTTNTPYRNGENYDLIWVMILLLIPICIHIFIICSVFNVSTNKRIVQYGRKPKYQWLRSGKII